MKMKIILFSLILSVISCKEEVNLLLDKDFQNAKQTLDNKVKSYGAKKAYPSNYRSYVSGWGKNKVEYIFDYVAIDSINSISKNHFPSQVESGIKAARYLSTASADSKIKYNTYKTSYEIDDYLGSAMKYKEYILFGIIHVTDRAELVPMYNKVGRKVCKRKWYCLWICQKCHTEYDNVKRGNTASEILIIQNALAAKSAEDMIYKINHF